MIPDWKQALSAATATISPLGRIHIVDFGDLENMPGTVRKALLAWLRLFHVEPRVELLGALAENAEKFEKFQILTGRYAFILASTAPGLSGITFPVALGSQGPDKTGFGSR
jgi:S-adenosylmethionine-diacylgycerolhomoserine-N-methlytransferase